MTDTPSADRRIRDLIFVTIVYVAAIAVGVWVGPQLAWSNDPLVIAGCADIAATILVFAASFAVKNSSMYDPYWSVAPIVLGIYWASFTHPEVTPDRVRAVLVLALVTAYGLRLTHNWARGWTGLAHEDWRYVDLQVKTKQAYWLVSFLGIHMFPSVQTFFGSVGVYVAVSSGARPLGMIDALAALVTTGGIVIEGLADNQLRRFRDSKPPAGAVLDTGLWAWSRHPNYFGEIAFWWGIGLFGLAADPGAYLVWVGPVSITVMFLVVSLPMIETRMRARRPAYAEHARRTSLLLPWPPKAPKSAEKQG